MPKFTLIKHPETKYDSEVTLTFEAELIEPAKAHFDDFLKASGFEIPMEDGTIDFYLEKAEDMMWNDAVESKFGINSADIIQFPTSDS
jgi:hypothetical protein